jgi:hypothetical protein
LELDETYYQEIGMTREQAQQQQREMMFALDPEAVTLDDLASVDAAALPEEWRKAIENLQVYGPQVMRALLFSKVVAVHLCRAVRQCRGHKSQGGWHEAVQHTCKHSASCTRCIGSSSSGGTNNTYAWLNTQQQQHQRAATAAASAVGTQGQLECVLLCMLLLDSCRRISIS